MGSLNPLSKKMHETPDLHSTASSATGHRGRLRDRFFRAGLQAFSDHEIIELVLTLAIPRRDVKPIAKALLAKFGSLKAAFDASDEDLLQINGFGENSLFAFRLIRSLVSHYLKADIEVGGLQAHPTALSEFWRARLAHETSEVFEVAYFDSGLRLLRDGVECHSRGTADRTSVFPGAVVKSALHRNAYAIAFAHNHPSNDLNPSDLDKLLTKQLVLAATAVQLHVVDHLIVGPRGFFSFREEGLL